MYTFYLVIVNSVNQNLVLFVYFLSISFIIQIISFSQKNAFVLRYILAFITWLSSSSPNFHESFIIILVALSKKSWGHLVHYGSNITNVSTLYFKIINQILCGT
jgi:hypothetical protein